MKNYKEEEFYYRMIVCESQFLSTINTLEICLFVCFLFILFLFIYFSFIIIMLPNKQKVRTLSF
jgi:hypothetical protein